MSLRVRRSVKLAPGVKLNLTKSGVGMTFGGRGAHYSVHSSGRRTSSFGLPGTGVYYQSVERPKAGHPATTRRLAPIPAPTAVDPASFVPRPGLFAAAAEKAYHDTVLAYLRGDLAATVANAEKTLASDQHAASAHLFAGIAAIQLDDSARAMAHLETVVGSSDGLPDKYQAKYLPEAVFSLALGVKITASITARPPFGTLGAVLALAELYQTAGRLEEAIGLLQQLHEVASAPLVRLSLCDLLLADGDYDGVVQASTGVTNESDIEVETLHIRGAAFVALGLNTAALEAFRDALAKTAQRDPGLLAAVRYDRGLLYERMGQPKKAKADYERLYAANPGYEDVRARLAALGTAGS